jgi:hypothetical protein
MAIASDRNIYQASHVTREVKDALTAESRRRSEGKPAKERVSVSRIIFELLKEGLERRGYFRQKKAERMPVAAQNARV